MWPPLSGVRGPSESDYRVVVVVVVVAVGMLPEVGGPMKNMATQPTPTTIIARPSTVRTRLMLLYPTTTTTTTI